MRYYSRLRPVDIGTYPKGITLDNVVNFDNKIYCEEIGREAWGYFETKAVLTDKQLEEYELTPEGMKLWYEVIMCVHDGGRVTANVVGTTEATEKPESSYKSTRIKDIYRDWFDTYEKAQAFVEEARMA